MNQDEIQQALDDISSRMDEGDTSLQDLSDNTDSTVSDISTTLDDHETRVTDVEANSGQLIFPLSQDSIDLINEQAPSNNVYLFNNNYIGTATLSGGTVTVTSNYVSTSSLILLSRISISGVSSATAAYITYVPAAGSFAINSSSAGDTSKIIYFILT